MKKSGKRTAIFIFALIFLMEFSFGFYLSYIYGFMSGDALSRVSNAFYVLYSRFPALANIGFVWNPLPSIMELFLLLFQPWIPALASDGLAAVLLTSLFSALSAAMLVKAGLRFGLNLQLSLVLALLYAFNPYIFYYGANGLTEVIFIYFLQLIVIQFLLWMDKADIRPMIFIAFALAAAFWTRYEAIPFGVAISLAVGIVIFKMRDEQKTWRERWGTAEGIWIVLITPVIYSGFLWLFFNYTIMGNAFYFLTSSYSNLGQAELIKDSQAFAKLIGHPWLAIKVVADKVGYFCLPLGVIALIRMVERRIFRWDFLILLLLVFSIPSLQLLLLIKGASAAWIRYYMYPLPLAMAYLPYEISRMKFRKIGISLLIVSLIVTMGIMLKVMNNPNVASDEYEAFHQSKLYEEQAVKREVARYISQNMSQNQHILTDSFSSFSIIMSSKHPKSFIITSDHDFQAALKDPVGQGVDFILIPIPNAVLKLDAVNQLYPNLYEHGASWTTLYKDFGGYWKLYKINR
ncbi:hypothetical protein EHS13_18860 [Paenibacillus psychroresistens]|uniref:Glycosyltransferase RgtA/B/C/D-like domain-containing protein n=1 Tax=Paenibacillus psychroresistens TaxID=1778678 RepID=A0A6B8RML6_9BACL|nr:glycosyltransferase family 39 protein [Paenibacillus psychroresistens]QGQ96793.1 hypothetical protein EHS13_18860 [Paenibacillus psychroresistens]